MKRRGANIMSSFSNTTYVPLLRFDKKCATVPYDCLLGTHSF